VRTITLLSLTFLDSTSEHPVAATYELEGRGQRKDSVYLRDDSYSVSNHFVQHRRSDSRGREDFVSGGSSFPTARKDQSAVRRKAKERRESTHFSRAISEIGAFVSMRWKMYE
jgi:hypothetical protein